jgi:hypothetical protein
MPCFYRLNRHCSQIHIKTIIAVTFAVKKEEGAFGLMETAIYGVLAIDITPYMAVKRMYGCCLKLFRSYS